MLFGDIILAGAIPSVMGGTGQFVSLKAMPGPDGAASGPTGASKLGLGASSCRQCSGPAVPGEGL